MDTMMVCDRLTREDWIWVEVMLMQALIGTISTNFRQITLSFHTGYWVVLVTLETDNANDREEVIEIAAHTSIYLEDVRDVISDCAYAKVEGLVEVIAGDSIYDREYGIDPRLIFRRKE